MNITETTPHVEPPPRRFTLEVSLPELKLIRAALGCTPGFLAGLNGEAGYHMFERIASLVEEA